MDTKTILEQLKNYLDQVQQQRALIEEAIEKRFTPATTPMTLDEAFDALMGWEDVTEYLDELADEVETIQATLMEQLEHLADSWSEHEGADELPPDSPINNPDSSAKGLVD